MLPTRATLTVFDQTERETVRKRRGCFEPVRIGQAAMSKCRFCTLDPRRKWIENEHALADAFNIGVNDGLAAGQTVDHARVHVIPRRKGDVPDPRGGIRWVIDHKANYWNK